MIPIICWIYMTIFLMLTEEKRLADLHGQEYKEFIMLHTTFIPYREFDEVLGIKGIDEYIRYGGTMSLGGINYNADMSFSNLKTAEEYIDTAIAKNIQHSIGRSDIWHYANARYS